MFSGSVSYQKFTAHVIAASLLLLCTCCETKYAPAAQVPYRSCATSLGEPLLKILCGCIIDFRSYYLACSKPWVDGLCDIAGWIGLVSWMGCCLRRWGGTTCVEWVARSRDTAVDRLI